MLILTMAMNIHMSTRFLQLKETYPNKSILDLMVCSNLVKITMSRFFIKKIADTMNTKSKITSKFVSISCKTCFGSVKPSSNAWKAIKPPGCRG